MRDPYHIGIDRIDLFWHFDDRSSGHRFAWLAGLVGHANLLAAPGDWLTRASVLAQASLEARMGLEWDVFFVDHAAHIRRAVEARFVRFPPAGQEANG